MSEIILFNYYGCIELEMAIEFKSWEMFKEALNKFKVKKFENT